jgi:quercetin dioxygenase-like cupin family protein
MGEDSRTFVRGLESDKYELEAFRQLQLSHHRVRDETVVTDTGESVGHSGATKQSRVSWRIGPGDEDFLTQTLQVHFIEIDGHGSNKGHGHQNEAAFYILEGAGYEIHDDLRYDWKKDDFVFVHTDSVHRHFNPYDEKAVCLVVKAKCTWMFLGLLQQGRGGPIDRAEEFGPREDWSAIWTPGVLERTKKISPEDTVWEDTDLGRIRVMTSPRTDHARLFSVDAFEFEIEPGGHTGKHWKMADEVLYAKDGDGYSLHWEVQSEIAERYYAHIALEPKRFDFKKGDTLYVPPNTVVQHFAADGTPVRLLSFQNRLFKHLGYDNVKVFEPASILSAAAEEDPADPQEGRDSRVDNTTDLTLAAIND